MSEQDIRNRWNDYLREMILPTADRLRISPLLLPGMLDIDPLDLMAVIAGELPISPELAIRLKEKLGLEV